MSKSGIIVALVFMTATAITSTGDPSCNACNCRFNNIEILDQFVEAKVNHILANNLSQLVEAKVNHILAKNLSQLVESQVNHTLVNEACKFINIIIMSNNCKRNLYCSCAAFTHSHGQ